jgi:hypothetical protein
VQDRRFGRHEHMFAKILSPRVAMNGTYSSETGPERATSSTGSLSTNI